ncbi:MAG: GatB/YqeY domain-containing protein [Dehalococcoidia bacterium]|nr:GatB/YqeY domain-containing protein [Dehalococcoidia bacterium]MDP6783321.1 GatB/YqeY domain-containing protein [Dehalococcoidia bacterium]
MNIEQKLRDDLKDAMRSRDKLRLGVLRSVLSRVGYAQIGKDQPLTDADVLGMLSKEAQQRQESIEAYKKGNRPDLVTQEDAELKLLQDYLPQALSRDEVMEFARRVVAEVGAQGPKDKGKVMPRVVGELKGRADGRLINEVVTQLLSGD